MKKTTIVLPIKATVSGRYKIEAVKADGSRRLLADWFDNMIVNNGLDLMGAGSAFTQYCSVGTGNTAPANTQTALVTFLAATNTQLSQSNANNGASPYVGTTTIVYQFPIGAATGNLSEVGIGAANNGTNLFSRALILDGGGSPTTITVLSSEALNVTYQLQQWVPLTDVTGSVTISGTSYSYTARAANATSWNGVNPGGDQCAFSSSISVYNGSIGAITGSPSGTNGGGTGTVSLLGYTTGNYYNDTQYTFALAQGNVSGGISAFYVTAGVGHQSWGQYQIGVSPSIPKDNAHTLVIVFRLSWAAH